MLKRFAIILLSLLAVGACNADQHPASATAAATVTAPTEATASPSAVVVPPAARDWQIGADYALIDPRVPTQTGNKIEVVEVFSYACPHCAHFQPSIDEIKAKLPANAQLVLIPAVFNAQWEPFARAFYAARSMGVLDQTHQALFDALHKDHQQLFTLEALATDFYAKHGVNATNFISTANSFVVDGELAHAADLVRQYGVTGTPTMIVNGKYRVEMNAARNIGPAEAVQIVLFLVAQESAAAKTK